MTEKASLRLGKTRVYFLTDPDYNLLAQITVCTGNIVSDIEAVQDLLQVMESDLLDED